MFENLKKFVAEGNNGKFADFESALNIAEEEGLKYGNFHITDVEWYEEKEGRVTDIRCVGGGIIKECKTIDELYAFCDEHYGMYLAECDVYDDEIYFAVTEYGNIGEYIESLE